MTYWKHVWNTCTQQHIWKKLRKKKKGRKRQTDQVQPNTSKIHTLDLVLKAVIADVPLAGRHWCIVTRGQMVG